MDGMTDMCDIRYKTSEQLISTDIHTSVSNYKFTYSGKDWGIMQGLSACGLTRESLS